MVVTVHPVATDVAVRVMREGGNAIDAAVAAAFMLGVVDGHNSGIGGGCFMLVRLADGSIHALDGREMAPAAAHRDMFIREGVADTTLSQVGPLASGIPGSVAVYEHAVREWGNKDWPDLILPAAEVAERGFVLNRSYERRLRGAAGHIARFEESSRILLQQDGQPYEEGDTIVMTDLARTYRAIAEHGAEWFYRGEFPQHVEQWMKQSGGIITAEDFANYEMKVRDPVRTSYRGYEIIGFPPPSSGGVHVAQILNILEHFDLAELEEQDPAQRIHVMAEAMKLAFADRAHWLGDPDYADVPKGLVDAEYGRQLAARIDREKVVEVETHGTPPRAQEDFFGDRHTTHLTTADAEGNWVALTATVNTAFGSKVIIPATGVVMNNQMDDFSVQPGVPNVFGLVGAEANAVEPGKRPLSSMSPTIVLRDGEPILTAGASGGPRIITQVVLALTNHLDLGDDVYAALRRPRFHHQWLPDQLSVERTIDAELLSLLEQRGHVVRRAAGVGSTQAIRYTDGQFVGVHEPRTEGKAAGP